MSDNLPKDINTVIEWSLVRYKFMPAFNATLEERVVDSKKNFVDHILYRNKDRSKCPCYVKKKDTERLQRAVSN